MDKFKPSYSQPGKVSHCPLETVFFHLCTTDILADNSFGGGALLCSTGYAAASLDSKSLNTSGTPVLWQLN